MKVWVIEETGISHTWEPVLAGIAEGSSMCCHTTVRLDQGPTDPEREAKLDARELLWAVWSKCQPNLSRASGNHDLHVALVAWYFADFVIDNICNC